MQTTNGTPNGARARSGPTGQPTIHVNGANPATPVGNNHSAAMRVANNNTYTHQNPQFQPRFPGQHQLASYDGNTYEMAVRGGPGAPMPTAQVHTQSPQQPPQGQQIIPGPQPVNHNFNPVLPIFNNPATLNALYQLASTIAAQPSQSQYPQQYQTPQQHGTPQQYGSPQQYQSPQQHHNPQFGPPQQFQNLTTNSTPSANLSRDNTGSVNTQASRPVNYSIPSPPHSTVSGAENRNGSISASESSSPNAGNSPSLGVAESSQSSTNIETPEQFQERVNGLVENKDAAFLGLIGNDAEYRRYKHAVWKAKLSGGSYENKAHDFPEDRDGQIQIKKRIVDAFFNLDGEQDPATETGEFANCLAVKIVRGLSPIQAELLAHELMMNMKNVQSGEPVTTPDFKVVQEETFAAKVNEVVAALNVNKLLCRSAMTADNLLARIAADPAGERRKKVNNIRNNMTKAKVLAADSLKKGTSRKGKGKRAAVEVEAEAEAEADNEAGAEGSEAVGRPTKRPRITKKSSQPAQVQSQAQAPLQDQLQPVQFTAAGHTNTTTVDTTQGAANPNQIAFNQTHHDHHQNNHGLVEQTPQASNSASNDLNHGFAEQNHQVTDLANNCVGPNQIDGPYDHNPVAAADQIQSLSGQPSETQADFNMANGWEDFGYGDNQSSEGMNFNWSLDPALAADPSTMDFIYQFQGLERPSVQEQQPSIQEQQPSIQEQQPSIQEQQPVIHEQQRSATQEQQPVVQEEQPVIQQQLPVIHEEQVEQAGQQQGLDDDLFGDAEFAASMQFLAYFNAQN